MPILTLLLIILLLTTGGLLNIEYRQYKSEKNIQRTIDEEGN